MKKFRFKQKQNLNKGEILFKDCYIKKVKDKIHLYWSKDEEEITDLVDGNELDFDKEGWGYGKWEYKSLKNGYYKCDVLLHFFSSFNGETTEYDMDVNFERIYPVKPSKVKNKIKFGIKNKYIPKFVTQYEMDPNFWDIKR